MRAATVGSLSLVLAGAFAAMASDWPQFRGPGGRGLPEQKSLPAEWAADRNVAWKVKIPGVAWSCPIVAGDKIFVTTAITENQRKPRAGGFGGGNRPEGSGGQRPAGERPPAPPGGGRRGGGQPPDVMYRWELVCMDRATGKILWQNLATEAKPRIPTHSSNTYASETPVTDGERVYVYFGMTGLFCFDMEGNVLWKKDLGAFRMQSGWGTASSPALDDARLYVQCDNEQESFLVALDKKTGNEVWRASRPEKSTWGSPLLWKNSKRTELVSPGSQKVRSYDPATGKVLWELGVGGGRSSASPVGVEDMLYVGVGADRGGGMGGRPMGGERGDEPAPSDQPQRGQPQGGRQREGAGGLFAVKAGASGDITLKMGETANEGVAWCQPRGGPSMASPLVYQGHIYIFSQHGGMVSCYDAKTGKAAYERERIPGAKSFWASPWAYDGKVFSMDDDGQTFVLQAGPTYKVIGKNALAEMCWSTPAAAGDALLVRGVDHLYCIRH
jgi:outer membrane protein assembly factor BamB